MDDGPNCSQDQLANSLVADDYSCSIWISFYEIYNEQIYDLLVPFTGKKPTDRPTLKLGEDSQKNVYVKGKSTNFSYDFYETD